ncbi:hypothetical protein [Vibrio penaeicida]|uniref:hypothetical protein n=1 Tax=Vibrio penaeicida TaxID=104609 RepID=UPI001CC3BF9D|nr:hypothetical protein [Vibrio penaeicida]
MNNLIKEIIKSEVTDKNNHIETLALIVKYTEALLSLYSTGSFKEMSREKLKVFSKIFTAYHHQVLSNDLDSSLEAVLDFSKNAVSYEEFNQQVLAEPDHRGTWLVAKLLLRSVMVKGA